MKRAHATRVPLESTEWFLCLINPRSIKSQPIHSYRADCSWDFIVASVFAFHWSEGPIKEGDVVFSTDKHHVKFANPILYQTLGYQAPCVLETRDRLVVVQRAATRSDETLLVKLLGAIKRSFPFCSIQADVVLPSRQATLKVDVWESLEDAITHLF